VDDIIMAIATAKNVKYMHAKTHRDFNYCTTFSTYKNTNID